jgi:SAM-dependent methyltransferase
MSTPTREEIVSINQKGWNQVAQSFYGVTALPKYGPLAQTEDELNLIPNLSGRSVLELGCGSGHTLAYLRENRSASYLWGLDFSEEQIRFTKELLCEKNIPARLFQSSMDENPGIPENHFDLIVSIYALGWTPDLARTLALVYSYLQPGGSFVFSWEHPVYQCLEYNAEIGKYIFENSYQQEGPELHPTWRGVEIFITPRKMSTYLNALIQSGLVLDQLIESEPNAALAQEKDYASEKWYSLPRAELLPTTFIVKARKPK